MQTYSLKGIERLLLEKHKVTIAYKTLLKWQKQGVFSATGKHDEMSSYNEETLQTILKHAANPQNPQARWWKKVKEEKSKTA